MTSRPLFISVAESIVILPPIAQVGCLSACSTVTSSSSARVRPRNGPPEAVTTSRSTVPARSPRDQLVQRGVLGVDRDQLRAGGLGQRGHELAADDERLLVGQRDVDALGERDDRRAQAGRADDRVEHEVGARTPRRAARGPRARRAPRRRSTPRPRARRRRRPRARSGATPCAARLLDERLVRRAGGQPDQLELARGALDDVERLRADRARGAEDEEPPHGSPLWQGSLSRG